MPFFGNQKICPDFGKKGSDCIQNLGVSRRTIPIFCQWSFFSCVFDEMFMEALKFNETFPALKNFWLRA